MTTTNVPAAAATADSMEADKYKAAFIWVSPDIAERWLGRNDKNRNVAPRIVDRYKRDMIAGNWAFTGEAVKFAADGKLLDGQHRLRAVIASGATVLMLVVRGIDQAAQDVMDTGRRRTAADMLTMHDKGNATLVAAAARLIVAYQNGSIRHADSQFLGEITNSEVLALVESDPYVVWAVSVAKTFNGVPANPAAVAFATYVMGRVDAESARDFLSAVAEMRTDGTGDPRHTLLRRLQVARDQRERLTSVQQAYLIIRAWSARRDGLTLKQLKMASTSGPMPFPTFTTPAGTGAA